MSKIKYISIILLLLIIAPLNAYQRIDQGGDVSVGETIDISGIYGNYLAYCNGHDCYDKSTIYPISYLMKLPTRSQQYKFYIDPSIFNNRLGKWYRYDKDGVGLNENTLVFNIINPIIITSTSDNTIILNPNPTPPILPIITTQQPTQQIPIVTITIIIILCIGLILLFFWWINYQRSTRFTYIPSDNNQIYTNPKPTPIKKEIDNQWLYHQLNNNFEHMNGHDFECFMAVLFEEMGYTSDLRRKSRDQGADIILKRNNITTIVQCKKNKIGNNIGNGPIQMLIGSKHRHSADETIFVTTSFFTHDAIKQSYNIHGDGVVEYWDKNKINRMSKKYLLNISSEILKNKMQKKNESRRNW